MFAPLRHWISCCCAAAVLLVAAAAAQESATPADPERPAAEPVPPESAGQEAEPAGAAATRPRVYVIPVENEISPPSLYVLRRGLKEAIETGAGFVLLDMDTPGGRADVMLEMMEALERFDGTTATYVNDEAGSAGALIAAVTDEIYFAPTGVMGAAELITGTGADVPEGLKRKMTSYINAKVRALSDSDPRRADVLKAMTSPEYEFVLDDEVLKPSGELLTVTAKEALQTYGEPPRPLLAAGVAADVEGVLAERFGPGNFEVIRLEVTWSESVAQWLTAFAPVLLGLGLLGLFIEFKTPGFGVFGVVGGLLMLVVFFGHYVAGLSGHEPAIVFVVGVVLVVVELFFFPGSIIVGLAGVLLMLGSLVWSMADLWPNEPIEFSSDVFLRPLTNLSLGILLAAVGALVLVRFLPRGWFWDRLILAAAVGRPAPAGGALVEPLPSATPVSALVGKQAVAVTGLFPSGQVEVDGRRYEARLEVGFAEAGTIVVVRAQREFGLVVEPLEAEA